MKNKKTDGREGGRTDGRADVIKSTPTNPKTLKLEKKRLKKKTEARNHTSNLNFRRFFLSGTVTFDVFFLLFSLCFLPKTKTQK